MGIIKNIIKEASDELGLGDLGGVLLGNEKKDSSSNNIKGNNNSSDITNDEAYSRRCKSCGAVLSGKKGEKVVCEYCDQASVL